MSNISVSGYEPAGGEHARWWSTGIGILMLGHGIARAIWALVQEARHSRATIILLATLSLIFGIAILGQRPLSYLWSIGLFASCDLVVAGLYWCWIEFSSGYRQGPRFHRQQAFVQKFSKETLSRASSPLRRLYQVHAFHCCNNYDRIHATNALESRNGTLFCVKYNALSG